MFALDRLFRFRTRRTGACSPESPPSASAISLPQDAVTEPPPATEAVPPPLPPSPADPLDNRAWLKLVGECVDLYDEFDSHLEAFDPSRRELAEHLCLRLQEILSRCDVELIDQDGAFERTLHQPPGTPKPTGEAEPRIRILSPGFRVGRRILRRARVDWLREIASDTTGESA